MSWRLHLQGLQGTLFVNVCRVEALGACQAFIALYTERITEDAQPLFPINSLRNQVQRIAPVYGCHPTRCILALTAPQNVWPHSDSCYLRCSLLSRCMIANG
jgi:hypothetical protein